MRTSGILLPIFSLPSPYGIGTLGREAYRFVDFLKKAGQTYWQVLPVGPTGFGDSPYQSFSAYAGNPYFIDLELLCDEGLLDITEVNKIRWCSSESDIEYDTLFGNRLSVLHGAFERFKISVPEDYGAFCNECKPWLDDYALFMAVKDANGGKPWYEWGEEIKFRNDSALKTEKEKYSDSVDFYKFINYVFSKQWFALKKYANKNGIKIIGDMPIYVALDSADVWANPKQFMLDESLRPKALAGCPPDAFSSKGQLWGNPLYNWEYMKNEKPKYNWWRSRIAHGLDMFDVLRIDHFRGFEAFYAINADMDSAEKGKWLKGPGIDLFNCINDGFGTVPIIAEDLGLITPPVRELLKLTGFPGMKVLQFAFSTDEESLYLPHNHNKNCVLYTGTHDNDTIIGWAENADKETYEFAKRYMQYSGDEGFNWCMIKTALSSVADTVIIPFQDYLGLGSEARINTPATPNGNWKWRVDGTCINDWLAEIIRENTQLYFRIPQQEKTAVQYKVMS